MPFHQVSINVTFTTADDWSFDAATRSLTHCIDLAAERLKEHLGTEPALAVGTIEVDTTPGTNGWDWLDPDNPPGPPTF